MANQSAKCMCIHGKGILAYAAEVGGCWLLLAIVRIQCADLYVVAYRLIGEVIDGRFIFFVRAHAVVHTEACQFVKNNNTMILFFIP